MHTPATPLPTFFMFISNAFLLRTRSMNEFVIRNVIRSLIRSPVGLG